MKWRFKSWPAGKYSKNGLSNYSPCRCLKNSGPICHTALWLMTGEPYGVLGAAPALSQLHIPQVYDDQVRIISRCLEQWLGIRTDEVAAYSALAATASIPMKREPSPPSVSEEGLLLS